MWDAELRFPVMRGVSDKTRKLEISCFAKEPRSDDILGRGVVDISETLKTGEFDGKARTIRQRVYERLILMILNCPILL